MRILLSFPFSFCSERLDIVILVGGYCLEFKIKFAVLLMCLPLSVTSCLSLSVFGKLPLSYVFSVVIRADMVELFSDLAGSVL